MAGNEDMGPSHSTAEDLTGQARFAHNLMVSWLSQLVLIVSGFVMPRLVDEKVGQAALGIWDFGWSFVSYLSLLGLGMGASFNRYIAKHRAAGDISGMNRIANSVLVVQIAISTLVFLATLVFYAVLPRLFGTSLGEHMETAQWVVLFLGLAVTVQMLSGCARGLLTGYHRWDIHNTLHAGASVTSLFLMIGLLYLTPLGVMGMAIGYLIAITLFELLRYVMMRRVCSEFTLDLSLCKKSTCKEMMLFGIKSMLSNLPPILLLQTVNIMLVSIVGPAALAVFARPVALIRHLKTFIAKFTMMLTPTTGSLQGMDDLPAIRQLYLNSTRLSAVFSLFSLGALFCYGDRVLLLWMGEDYAHAPLMMLLAAGQLLPMAQDTSIRILMGMNRHGRISLAAFVLVFVFLVIGLLLTGTRDWQLEQAAGLLLGPLVLVYGLLIPYYTCRCLELPFGRYWLFAIGIPFLAAVPYFAILAGSRYLFNHQYYSYALLVAVVSFVVAGWCYFRFLANESTRGRFKRLLRKRTGG